VRAVAVPWCFFLRGIRYFNGVYRLWVPIIINMTFGTFFSNALEYLMDNPTLLWDILFVVSCVFFFINHFSYFFQHHSAVLRLPFISEHHSVVLGSPFLDFEFFQDVTDMLEGPLVCVFLCVFFYATGYLVSNCKNYFFAFLPTKPPTFEDWIFVDLGGTFVLGVPWINELSIEVSNHHVLYNRQLVDAAFRKGELLRLARMKGVTRLRLRNRVVELPFPILCDRRSAMRVLVKMKIANLKSDRWYVLNNIDHLRVLLAPMGPQRGTSLQVSTYHTIDGYTAPNLPVTLGSLCPLTPELYYAQEASSNRSFCMFDHYEVSRQFFPAMFVALSGCMYFVMQFSWERRLDYVINFCVWSITFIVMALAQAPLIRSNGCIHLTMPFAVVIEEILKFVTGAYLFAYVEFFLYLHSHGLWVVPYRIPAFLMHCLTGLCYQRYNYWGFVQGFIIHLAFNRLAYGFNAYATGTLELSQAQHNLIKMSASAFHTVQMCMKRDLVGLSSFFFASGMFEKLLSEDFQFSDLVNLVNLFPKGSMDEPYTNHLQLTSADDAFPRVPSFMKTLISLLPLKIRASPVTSAIISLFVSLVGISAFGDLEIVKVVTNYFVFDEISAFSNVFSLCVHTTKCFANAIYSMRKCGTWWDFFYAPSVVATRFKIFSFLNSDIDDRSVEELDELITAGELLLEKVNYADHKSLNCFLKDLNLKINQLEKTRDSIVDRIVPLLVWIVGPPGTGKSTIIDTLRGVLGSVLGKKVNRSEVLNINPNEKFPIEVNTNTHAKIAIINDLTSDRSEDLKQNLSPVDEMIRNLQDFTPCTFQMAAVEDKGQTFNKIKMTIITSNEASYKFANPTLRLERRILDGVSVGMTVRDVDGAVIDYERYKHWSPEKRNDRTCFTFYRPKVSGNHMYFQVDEALASLNLHEFISFMYGKLQTHFAVQQSNIYFRSNSLCICGSAQGVHFTNGEWKPFTPICVKRDIPSSQNVLLCKCGLVETSPIHPCRKCPCHKRGNTFFVPEDISSIYPPPVENTRRGQRSRFEYTSYELPWWYLLVAYFFGALTIVKYMDVDVSEVAVLRVRRSELFMQQVMLRILSFYSTTTYWCRYVQSRKRYLDFVIWCQVHSTELKIASGSLLTSVAVAFLYRNMFGRDMEFTGNVIMSQDVNPKSMVTANDRVANNTDLRESDQSAKGGWFDPNNQRYETTLVTVGVNTNDLIAKARQHLIVVSLRDTFNDTVETQNRAFVLSPTYLLINRHYLDVNGILAQKTIMIKGLRQVVCKEDVSVVEGTETYILRMHNPIITAHNLMKFFPQIVESNNLEASRVSENEVREVVLMRRVTDMPPYGKMDSFSFFDETAGKGDCGIPLVAHMKGGAFITSIISFSAYENYLFSRKVSGGSVITMPALLRAVEKFPEPCVNALVLSDSPYSIRTVQPLDPNSVLRKLHDTPSITVLGTVPGPVNRFHSSLEPSALYAKASVHLKDEWSIPKRTDGMVGEGNSRVFRSAFLNTYEPCMRIYDAQVDTGAFLRAIDLYLAHAVVHDVSLSPLTLDEAIFGEPSQLVDRINFKTSLGPVLKEVGCKNKNDLFEPDDAFPFRFKAEVRARIDALILNLKSGNLEAPVITASYKDEVRKRKKLDEMDVRIFSSVDFVYNIVMRMYLSPLVQYLLKYPYQSKCFGGANAASFDWDKLARYLQQGGFFLDLDFKKYDASQQAFFFFVVSLFFYKMALKCKYTPEAARVVFFVVYMLCVQVVLHKNDVFVKRKGMPSGVIVTLILNSILNILLMIVAYYELVGGEEFFQNVFPMVVGDDNVSGIMAKIAEKYNILTIQKCYEKMGFRVTSADKNDVARPFVPFDELQFVKRNFVKRANLGYVAPISTDSIWKALAFQSQDCGVSHRDRLIAVLEQVQREWFLHGEEAFIRFQSFLDEIETSNGIYVKRLDFCELTNEYIVRGLFLDQL
jgi:energy-coupling factor transporter ATP-binding protein EcfA2